MLFSDWVYDTSKLALTFNVKKFLSSNFTTKAWVFILFRKKTKIDKRFFFQCLANWSEHVGMSVWYHRVVWNGWTRQNVDEKEERSEKRVSRCCLLLFFWQAKPTQHSIGQVRLQIVVAEGEATVDEDRLKGIVKKVKKKNDGSAFNTEEFSKKGKWTEATAGGVSISHSQLFFWIFFLLIKF